MAGGGGSLGPGPKQKRGKHGKRKAKKRVGFALDMTPLVDITFLLLTFFMFTTTMAAPQIMEMSVPPERTEDVEVRASELMSLFVTEKGEIFWFIGEDDAQPVAIKDLRKLAEIENLREKVKNRLITVLKVSNDVGYGKVVEILDELNLAEIKITEEITKEKAEDGKPKKRERKFVLAELSEDDLKKIEDIEGGTAK